MPKRDLIVLASLLKLATLFGAVNDEHILRDEAFHWLEKDQGV
jgi:hypothetical protein